MPSAKLITSKRIKGLAVLQVVFSLVLAGFVFPSFSQDNSPYSRYGLGDLVPSTNVNSRGMGSISAGYNDIFSINFNNPASYGSFQTIKELNAKKMLYGRAILDMGINIENRTLREPNNIEKFSASNALFSHIQVGVPLSPNWGLSFGLRPITRIAYKLNKREGLTDPFSGLFIDSAITTNEGDGGSFLASAGLGHKIILSKTQSLSLGMNGGYFFGKQDYSSRRSIFNDSITYTSGNFQTRTAYGDLYFNAGLQYETSIKQGMRLIVGAHGNWKQQFNASRDIIRETYFFDESTGNVRIDSVKDQKNIKGEVIYPGSFTAGFVLEKFVTSKEAGWLIGIDYTQNKWSDYRVYGQADPSIKDKWELRAGAQLRPAPKANYFSNVAYRAGVFFGPDYINVNKKLPVFGATFGLGLPILNYNRQSPGQATIINLAFEFIKRGNNDNLLKENLFRLSAGFSLSDFWFTKKKYD
ncbi:MAG: hypothetical protein ACSLE0_04955 [Chitinophagaceae bacterium]